MSRAPRQRIVREPLLTQAEISPRQGFEMTVMDAGKAMRAVGAAIEAHPTVFTSTDAGKAFAFLTAQLHAVVNDVTAALKAAEKIKGATFSLDSDYVAPTEELRIKMGQVDISSGKPVIHAAPDLVLQVPRTTVLPPAEIITDDDADALEALEARESVYRPVVPKVGIGERPTDKHKATGRLVGKKAGDPDGGAVVFELEGGEPRNKNDMPDMAGEVPDKTGGIPLAGFVES